LPGLGIDHPVALQLPTGLLQQADGRAQVIAHLVGVATDGVGVGGCEHPRRDLVLQPVEDFQFLSLGQAGGRKLGAPEEAIDPLQAAIGKVLVEILEVVGVVQRFADPRVLEDVTAHVRHESLHDADGLEGIGQCFLGSPARPSPHRNRNA
jgi:hypothetical protein